MIQIDNASKRFTSNSAEFLALRDVSLHIEQGMIFGIIGRSGAGKSTLLRLINRLESPSAGRILIDQVDVASLEGLALRRLRQRVGMVFQHFNLLQSKTVAENVRLPLRVAGTLSRAAQDQRVEEMLELVGLLEQGRKYPHALSGGQRQRVGIARALVNRPEVLLCDEATSALDPETTEAVLNLLLSIHRRFKLTIVLVTHSMGVIRSLADRVAVVDHGRVVETGTVADVFLHPRQEVTQALLRESGFEFAADSEKIEDRSRVVRLSYRGDAASEPLLTRIARESGLDFSLLRGSVGRLKELPFGQFTIALKLAEQDDLSRFLAICARHGVEHEVVH
jgi:D-methionine transport system ATP-binding protein